MCEHGKNPTKVWVRTAARNHTYTLSLQCLWVIMPAIFFLEKARHLFIALCWRVSLLSLDTYSCLNCIIDVCTFLLLYAWFSFSHVKGLVGLKPPALFMNWAHAECATAVLLTEGDSALMCLEKFHVCAVRKGDIIRLLSCHQGFLIALPLLCFLGVSPAQHSLTGFCWCNSMLGERGGGSHGIGYLWYGLASDLFIFSLDTAIGPA